MAVGGLSEGGMCTALRYYDPLCLPINLQTVFFSALRIIWGILAWFVLQDFILLKVGIRTKIDAFFYNVPVAEQHLKAPS